MQRTSKRIILTLIIATIISMLIPTNAEAAAGSYKLSKTSASINVGKTTTITVTTVNCEGKFTVSSSNTSVATVSTSSFWEDEKGTTITITAKSAGSATITITPVDVTDTDLNEITGSKTCKITVTKPQTSTSTGTSTNNKPSTNTGTSGSSNNSSSNSNSTSNSSSNNTTTVKKSDNSKLSSLQITEGVISPEFSSDVKEYSVSVPNEVTKLTISAKADDSKATVKITGNEELKVGDNNIEVTVTAEDGSKTTYKVLAKRAQPELSMQTLTVGYIDENGQKVELVLNPQFAFNVYEYSVAESLPHTVNSLEVLGTANRENTKIEVIGDKELKTGENEIIIKAIVTDEAGLEEQKTYVIRVNKEEAPVVATLTTMDKIKNWFGGAGTTISTWVKDNFNKIVAGLLLFVSTAFVALTVYVLKVGKKYKEALAKLAEFNKANLKERANVALDPEIAKNNAQQAEYQEKFEAPKFEQEPEATERPNIKFARGRRFK